MKRTTDVLPQEPKTRLRYLLTPVVLSVALVAGACSSDGSASPATTTSDPVSTTTAAPTPSTTTPPSTAPESDDLEAYFDQLETRGFDGVVTVRDGADIVTRAYGTADRGNDVPVDAETVFDIASITKQFTAAAILRLEMDGLLSVDDALGDHLPGLPADKAAITLHQLLTHTAGLPRDLGSDYEPIGRSDFLALVGEAQLESEPGERYEYSNTGYALLAAVIEFETGEPYEAYLRTTLLEPAGMLDTGYVLPDWDGHTIAVGYNDASGERFGRPNEQLWDVDGPYWHLRGNGGLLSTAADMLRWEEAMMGDDVLDETARAKFFAPHVPLGPDEEIQYGYGWLTVPTPMGTPLITHNGFNGFFYADFLHFVDQDVTIFVATNSYEDDAADLASDVANHMFDGALTAMAGSEDEAEDEADAGPCRFDGLSVEPLPDYPEIETLPDSPSGRIAEMFLDLLAEGDAAARLDFATDYMTTNLGSDEPAGIADAVESLQETLADYEVARILEEDDHRFHLLMQGPGVDLLLSMGFDETDPELLACVAIWD